ncbi:MAG: PD40 domain-containing protein, partial [Bacteroidales bacterium]|nr:PD40 domain-containing protein [Bacteroidales bacterium]
MKQIHIFILIVILFSFSQMTMAQTTAQLKADKQFERLNYSKALERYLEIAKKEYPKANKNYINLHIADCYRLTSQTDSAETWYTKSINSDCDPIYYSHYANTLKINGKYDESNKWIKKYNSTSENKKQQTIAKEQIDAFHKMASRYKITALDINTPFAEFSPAYYNDSILFVSSRDTSTRKKSGWTDQAYYSLYETHIDSTGEFSKVNELSGSFGTKYHEGPMSFYPPDSILYFTRNNPIMGKKGKSNTDKRNLQILTVKYKNGQWTNFTELDINNKEYSCAHPTLSADGQTLYFASDMPNGIGGTDIYKLEKDSSEWSAPINLGKKINSEGNEMFPFITDDETLFFASDGHEGLGGLDIFYASKNGSKFGKPRNIGSPVNSSKDDFGLITQGNKRIGYFSSNRNIGKDDDIYRFEYLRKPPIAINDSFVIAKNTIDIPINIIINDSAGDLPNFYIHYVDPLSTNGSTLKLDSNVVTYTPKTNFFGIETMNYVICDDGGEPMACDTGAIIFNVLDNVNYFIGQTKRKRNKDSLANVKIYLYKKDVELAIDSTFSNETGKFFFNLIDDNEYTVACTKEDYYDKIDEISTFNITNDTIRKTVLLKMLPYALEGIIVYRNSEIPVDSVDVILSDNEVERLGYVLTSKNGKFHFPLEESHKYKVIIMKDSFLVRTAFITTEGIKPQVIKMKEIIELDSMRIGQTIEVEIFYNLGKHNIRPDAAKTLDEEVIQLLIDNPGLSLEFGAHTDARGRSSSNQALSQRRATAAANYISGKNISSKRISGVGYGETRLKNHCKDGVSCSEKLHQENRRAEIVVTGIEMKTVSKGFKKDKP